MRGHAAGGSRKFNRHWQSEKKSVLRFVYTMTGVTWHHPETYGYQMEFKRNHNEPNFDRTIRKIHFYTKELPVYPNPTATYMGAIGIDKFSTSNYVSKQFFGQQVDRLVDIPDITTSYHLKVGNRTESNDIRQTIDFASHAFYRGGGFSNGTPSIVFPGTWSGTPAGTQYGSVGYGASGTKAVYQQVANDIDITINLTTPLRITKYTGSTAGSFDFCWYYFIHTTNQAEDLAFLNNYINKTKIIVEFE